MSSRNFCEIEYTSTRGGAPDLGFRDVLLKGLAEDGGLYVPKTLPKFTPQDFSEFKNMSYKDVAKKVLSVFIGHIMSEQDLSDLVDETYASFHHKDICPLVELDKDFWIMEQFHGPTLAFKDFALQFLGRIFDYVLKEKKQNITIVGATSGDTGSAAIEGCRGRENMNIFILHPHGRVSDVQRRQMTTVNDDNVFNIAIKGSFDDCQDLVKAMFNDHDFRASINMSAVNSINWARIMAQIVYYIYAASKFENGVTVFVPTGNFGNIYAGYLAKQMGTPIKRLVVATNKNDILYRFFQTGEMKIEGVNPSLSPSMDIQISSNFERLMFDFMGRDTAQVSSLMGTFRANKFFKTPPDAFDKMKQIFSAYRCDDEDTKRVTNEIYQQYDYVVDPHTATGVMAMLEYKKHNLADGEALLGLSTAHPSKFPDAVESAISVRPELPNWLDDLFERDEQYDICENDLQAVQQFILSKLNHSS